MEAREQNSADKGQGKKVPQGSGRFAAITQGFAASRFQRCIPFSFTRMALRGWLSGPDTL
jgi:hypothetical protein